MSNLEFRILSSKDKGQWDSVVKESSLGTIFHEFEWLRNMGATSGYRFLPLMAYRGEELFAIFPVFLEKKLFFGLIMSPPPKCAIPHLGPIIIDYETISQHQKERYLTDLIILLDNFIRDNLGIIFSYQRIILNPLLKDTRQFQWNSFDVKPLYSYVISLKRSAEDIFSDFKKQERTDTRRALGNDNLKVKKGGLEEILAINKLVMERYKAQGRNFGLTEYHLRNLYLNFHKNIEPITLHHSGKMVGGLILVKYKNTIIHWIGGTSPKESIIGANALLHWKVINEGIMNNYDYYELMGANTKHLSKTKSKFNPFIELYFECEKTSPLIRFFQTLVQKFRFRGK